MSLILHLETAGNVCSVALAEEGLLLSLRETDEKNAHSRMITLFIEEVLKEAGKELKQTDAVAVSEGPGSYTGLRIGVATAKGLCFSLEKPLIAIPTLQSMALGMAAKLKHRPAEKQLLFCPMLDARRMEVYSAIYTTDNKLFRETKAEIIDENSFSEYLKDHYMVFAGDGAEKCRRFLDKHPDVTFLSDFRITASSMIPLALERFHNSNFEDVAYFEPAYLKDFIAGKPRVKGLR